MLVLVMVQPVSRRVKRRRRFRQIVIDISIRMYSEKGLSMPGEGFHANSERNLNASEDEMEETLFIE